MEDRKPGILFPKADRQFRKADRQFRNPVSVIYLYLSNGTNITDKLKSVTQHFRVESCVNCKFSRTKYTDEYCSENLDLTDSSTDQIQSNYDYNVVTNHSLSWLGIIDFKSNQSYRFVFYTLPRRLLNSQVDYQHWIWGQSVPGLILIPNLEQNPKLNLPLKFKSFKMINENFALSLPPDELILHPSITFRFYLETRYPITVFDSNGKVVLGEINMKTDDYLDKSDVLDTTQTYYVSCNDVISRKTPPIIRILIGVYQKFKLLYSDYLIIRISPLMLLPNSQPVKRVYLSKITTLNENSKFLRHMTQILQKYNKPVTILSNRDISLGHRWVQDIFKYTVARDIQSLEYIILKGTHFETIWKKNKKQTLSYINQYFSQYPKYDFFYDTDNSLDGFGNIQVTPPIIGNKVNWPWGRIIYGISSIETRASVCYNVRDLLESQEIQKPIQVDTSWLHVGHVDEILSYVPDPGHRLGFRILIASPRKFMELVDQLDENIILFKNTQNYHIIDDSASDLNSRYQSDRSLAHPSLVHEVSKYDCLYKSQLRVADLRSWIQIQDANHEYQSKLDQVKYILMRELDLQDHEFYEIPVYYWPKTISSQAKSILPNMINNLFIYPFMMVPKPFVLQAPKIDLFETYFRSQVPQNIQVYFVDNWNSYYLLDGDINCGSNTQREPFQEPWWMHAPPGAYNL